MEAVRPPGCLTLTEQTVYGYLVQGLTYRQMMERMGRSFQTVNFHCQNIYAKLDVSGKREIRARALKATFSADALDKTGPV